MRDQGLRDDFQKLKVGDIFLATYPALSGDMGTAICLVVGLKAGQLGARTVTTQWALKFDRSSRAAVSDSGTPFIVQHAKPLPPDVHAALVGLDQRYSVGGEATLTNEEKRALLFVDSLLRTEDR